MIYVRTEHGSVCLVDEKQKISGAEPMTSEEVQQFEKSTQLLQRQLEVAIDKAMKKRQSNLKKLSKATGISVEEIINIIKG